MTLPVTSSAWIDAHATLGTQSRQEDPKMNRLLRSAREAARERRAWGRIRVGAIYRMGHQREVALQVEGAGGVRTPLIGT
jgi:hypothetical protein